MAPATQLFKSLPISISSPSAPKWVRNNRVAMRKPLSVAAAGVKYAHLPPPPNFNDPTCSNFSVAIMGDLHLNPDPAQMDLYNEAREQLIKMVSDADAARVVQLGDLGNYEHGWPGSHACFQLARDYLHNFNLPLALITGNHDLEGAQFETDEENLEAWHSAFGHRHYWSTELGPATFIGLSTVRFRSNNFSVHEVHIDDEQLEFLESELKAAQAAGRPVVMFTHAPIMGSSLKAIQAVHVKNRCAWVNHSSNPTVFMELVEKYPNIKLWFSGHFHLSQSYPDSISQVGSTAYVLTGVIGDHWSRDGHRHSRLLKGDNEGFELYTVDHDEASLRLDLKGRWEDIGPAQYLVPDDDLLCDPSTGWLCSQVEAPEVTWFNVGPQSMLSLQDDILVEYDVKTMAPIGAVFLNVPDNGVVRLVDGAGNEVDGVSGDGSSVAAVEIVDGEVGAVVMRTERNEKGYFYQVFQPNKWVARKKKEAEEAARAAAMATA